MSKRKQCICEWCNKSFETWQCRPGRFCSRKCAGQYGGSVSPGHPTSPDSYVTLNCEMCGNSYTVHKVFVEKRNSRFCSRKCMGDAKSLAMQANNNHNYRGGKVRYRGRNWEKQKRAALKRDNYQCQVCSKPLAKSAWDYGVHHITPYRQFNGDYKAANDLTNLVCLCRKCHGGVESGTIPLFNKNP